MSQSELSAQENVSPNSERTTVKLEGDTRKRAHNDDSTDDSGSAKLSKPDLSCAIRKQVEHYFSDANMKFDKFFQEKIAADPKGLLNIQYIMGCKKIKDLKVTEADIIRALEDSELTVEDYPEGGCGIKRPTPLPAVEERPRKPFAASPNDRRKGGRNSERGLPEIMFDESHPGGMIARLIGLPSSTRWEDVKAAILAKLDGKLSDDHALFVGSSEGETFVTFKKFDDDVAFVKENLHDIEIENCKVEVQLVDSMQDAQKILSSAPAFLRARYSVRKPSAVNNRKGGKSPKRGGEKPLTISGVPFSGISHLHSCLKQVLESCSTLDEPIAGKTALVLEELIKYHPNYEKKIENFKHFAVKSRPVDNGPNIKCFFVVREDGSSDDFSVVKCVDAMKLKLKDNTDKLQNHKDSATKSPSQEDSQKSASQAAEDAVNQAAIPEEATASTEIKDEGRSPNENPGVS